MTVPRKPTFPAQTKPGAQSRKPVAPAAYRPLPLPRVLQATQSASRHLPIQRGLASAMASRGGPANLAWRQPQAVGRGPGKAPPVYRPQPLPRVLAMKRAQAPSISGASRVFAAQGKRPPNLAGLVQRMMRPGSTVPGVRPPIHVGGQQRTTPKPPPPAVGRGPRWSGAIQCQKADAQTFADTNKLGITATTATVTAYVNDTTKPKDMRKGLLAAWNLNSTKNWVIDDPPDFGSSNAYHYSNFTTYQDWTTNTSGISLVTPFGTGSVSGYHNRGAPKISSRKDEWGKVDLGDKYSDYITGLRSNGLSDATIATYLLNQSSIGFTTPLEQRAAAMLHITVYLAEEWRKQGAAKIYRAILRTIASGVKDFDDFNDDYQFIKNANAGRQMVGRFYDVWLGLEDKSTLSVTEQEYYNVLSPGPADDYSSDEDMRTDDKKNLTVTRLYSKSHTT